MPSPIESTTPIGISQRARPIQAPMMRPTASMPSATATYALPRIGRPITLVNASTPSPRATSDTVTRPSLDFCRGGRGGTGGYGPGFSPGYCGNTCGDRGYAWYPSDAAYGLELAYGPYGANGGRYPGGPEAGGMGG